MSIFNISGSFDLGSLAELTKMEVEQHLFKYGEKKPEKVTVVYKKEHKGDFSCHMLIRSMNKEFIAEEIAVDPKVALGHALENMEKQLRRHHDKIYNRKEIKREVV